MNNHIKDDPIGTKFFIRSVEKEIATKQAPYENNNKNWILYNLAK